jgi:hypothetical protein
MIETFGNSRIIARSLVIGHLPFIISHRFTLVTTVNRISPLRYEQANDQ